jgi:hypothetical protein
MSVSIFNEVFTNRDISEIIFKYQKEMVEEMIYKEKLKEFRKLDRQMKFVEEYGFNTKLSGYAKKIEYYYDIKKYIYLYIDLLKSASKRMRTDIFFRDYDIGENIRFWKIPEYFKKKHFDNFSDLYFYICFKTKY